MEKHERALQELRDWVTKEGGGLQIIFAGGYISFVDNVPHAWQCTAANGRHPQTLYHAYGITFEDAIIKCHQRWSDQVTGYQYPMCPDCNAPMPDGACYWCEWLHRRAPAARRRARG